MLLRDNNHRLALNRRNADVRLVPLLDGGWFYDTVCPCGATTRGRAGDHAAAELAAYSSLPCRRHVHAVCYTDFLITRKAVALVAEHLPGVPIANRPFGWARLNKKRPRGEVAVDASVRPDRFAVAAVTGRGWVQIHRTATQGRVETGVAELMALYAGVRMLPPDLDEGVLLCDNKETCKLVSQLLDGTRSFTNLPAWLDEQHVPACASLVSLMRARNMVVQWRRRNSTPALRLADQLAWLASQQRFNGQRMGHRLDRRFGWVRAERDALAPAGTHVKYLYCDTTGTPLPFQGTAETLQ